MSHGRPALARHRQHQADSRLAHLLAWKALTSYSGPQIENYWSRRIQYWTVRKLTTVLTPALLPIHTWAIHHTSNGPFSPTDIAPDTHTENIIDHFCQIHCYSHSTSVGIYA